jgi:hypothetical protein
MAKHPPRGLLQATLMGENGGGARPDACKPTRAEILGRWKYEGPAGAGPWSWRCEHDQAIDAR